MLCAGLRVKVRCRTWGDGMNRQDDLFDAHYPDRPGHVRGSDTSEAAADSLDETSLSRLRRKVHTFIAAQSDGATCDEVEIALDLRHQTASARVRELVLTGFIEDTGQRRLTSSGRPARVYQSRCSQ